MVDGMSSTQTRRVLLVNATRDESDMYATWLRIQGYEATVATDGSSAAALVDQGPIDVLVTDVSIGNGDSGLALAGHVKENVALATRVIVLSGYPLGAIGRHESSWDVCLLKPCLPGELVNAVERVLPPPV
jgi:DNA-binding response OmpR family regulator